MKKIVSILLICTLCFGVLAGCGEKKAAPNPEQLKYRVPHNPEIYLSDSKDTVIEMDELEPKQIGDFEPYYAKTEDVSFAGVNFDEVSYLFDDNNKAASICYSSFQSKDIEKDKEKLKEYFSSVYEGCEAKVDDYVLLEGKDYAWIVETPKGIIYIITIYTSLGSLSASIEHWSSAPPKKP